MVKINEILKKNHFKKYKNILWNRLNICPGDRKAFNFRISLFFLFPITRKRSLKERLWHEKPCFLWAPYSESCEGRGHVSPTHCLSSARSFWWVPRSWFWMNNVVNWPEGPVISIWWLTSLLCNHCAERNSLWQNSVMCVYFSYISAVAEVKLRDDQYTLEHMHAFGMYNYLHCDSWYQDSVYYVDNLGRIMNLTVMLVRKKYTTRIFLQIWSLIFTLNLISRK